MYNIIINTRLFSQLKTTAKGLEKLIEWLWNLLLIPSPFAPIMFFYTTAPTLIVVLYYTSPGAQAGFDGLASMINLPWWTPVVVFWFCLTVGYEVRTPIINAILTIPLILYAMLLIAASLSGRFGLASLMSALILFVAGWAVLSLTRYYKELSTVTTAQVALQKRFDNEVRSLRAERDKVALERDRLKSQLGDAQQGGNIVSANNNTAS